MRRCGRGGVGRPGGAWGGVGRSVLERVAVRFTSTRDQEGSRMYNTPPLYLGPTLGLAAPPPHVDVQPAGGYVFFQVPAAQCLYSVTGRGISTLWPHFGDTPTACCLVFTFVLKMRLFAKYCWQRLLITFTGFSK